MNHYQKIMSEATGVTDPDDLNEIEDVMRTAIFHSTLDWQTREQLEQAAKQAWEIVKHEKI